MVISNDNEKIGGVLKAKSVLQSPDIVAKMEAASRAVACQHTFDCFL